MRTQTTCRIALIAGVAALATACAPNSDPDADQGPEDSGQETNLVVWGWTAADGDPLSNQIFSVFEEQNPGITVEYLSYPADSYETTLVTGMAAAGGPDVVQLQAYGFLQKHVEAGSLMELNPSNVAELSQFTDVALDGARGYKDQLVYGVPFAIQTVHIFYNKGLFAEHGLGIPTTWEEFFNAAEKLKAAGVAPIAWNFVDTWQTPALHEVFGNGTYGGGPFQDRLMAGETDFADPAYAASLKVLQDLVPYLPEGYTAMGYDEAFTLFTSGQAAMIPTGIWEVSRLRETATGIDIGLFAAPLAAGSTLPAPVTVTYVDGSFGISNSSRHKEAALKLVNWMATAEFGQLWSDVMGQFSARPDVEAGDDPLLVEALEASVASPSPYLCYAKLNEGTPSCSTLVTENVQQLMLGHVTAEEAAANIQRGIEQWFTPAG
jgi:raffinose/stachyose/melibiose transport system substrate-binding protein